MYLRRLNSEFLDEPLCAAGWERGARPSRVPAPLVPVLGRDRSPRAAEQPSTGPPQELWTAGYPASVGGRQMVMLAAAMTLLLLTAFQATINSQLPRSSPVSPAHRLRSFARIATLESGAPVEAAAQLYRLH